MHSIRYRVGRLAVAATLCTLPLAGCDFVSPTETNPNVIPEATLDQLFTGTQVNAFYISQMQMHRLASMWTQQMAGTDRQFRTLDRYVITDGELNFEMAAFYTGGGLIDIRQARTLAEELGCLVCRGILNIHEAYLFGTAASIWGDVPYSEAGGADPDNPPGLDPQLQVYASVQALLDEAIADLESGDVGGGAGDFLRADMNFGGTPEPWIRIAHTLKARYYLHVAEVEGAPAYQSALEHAAQGISDPSDNWTAFFSDATTENNLWYSFLISRDTYIRAGKFLVDLMQADADPRLPLYFTTGSDEFSDQIVGAPPTGGNIGTNASQLAIPGTPGYDDPILTCAETQFIAAEAALMTGGDAQSFLEAGVACQEAYWSSVAGTAVDIPDPGAATLETVIEQKYIANFLDMEAWNDYKRTCLPAIEPVEGGPVPARVFYGQQERQTNPNIPPPDQQPVRNPNDPDGC